MVPEAVSQLVDFYFTVHNEVFTVMGPWRWDPLGLLGSLHTHSIYLLHSSHVKFKAWLV